jgi:predicted nucleotidyltransferase
VAKTKPILPIGPLRDLLAWWRKAQIRGVIIGGLAVAFRGKARTTRDVDAVIFLEGVRLSNFLGLGERFSFQPRIPDALAYARENRVLLLHHGASNVRVDLSLGALPFENAVLERAQTVKVGRLAVPVATVEDLLVLKAIANRTVDKGDMEGLLDLNADVDIAYVRRHLMEFAGVLEMPEVLDDFDRMMSRREIKKPPKPRTKRLRKD